jgi:iron complex outermembrane receptor protein
MKLKGSEVNPIAKWMTATTHACLACALALIFFSTALPGEEVEARSVSYQLDIPAESLDAALQSLALASHHKLFYRAELVIGKTSRALKGPFTIEEAVRQLLTGTGLAFDISPASVVFIKGENDGKSGDAREHWPPLPTDAPPSPTAEVHVADIHLAQTTQTSTAQSVSQKPEESTKAKDEGIPEIVVTASKRETTLQRIPASLSVVTSAELQQRGIVNLESVLTDVPGVSLRTAGPGQTEIELRGLSSTGGSAPTVGFYLDDIPLTPPVSSSSGKTVVDPSLYDLARVEVLRGPQGTLYGSGSLGGTVRLITNQPELDHFGGSANVDGSGTVGGNTPNGAANVALNIPLIDDIAALRVVVGDSYESGWIDRIVLNPFPLPTTKGCDPGQFYGCSRGDVLNAHVAANYKDVNWTHTDYARATLLLRFTDEFKTTTTAMFHRNVQGGANTYDDPPGPSATLAHFEPADIAEPYEDSFWLIANTTSYSFDFATLTAASSYSNRIQKLNQDTSESYQNLFFLPTFLTDSYNINPGWDYVHQFSEEVRLASPSDGRLTWIGGFFYSYLYSDTLSLAMEPALCYLTNGGCAANPTGILFNSSQVFRVNEYAGFGEVAFKILPTLTLTAGGRYFAFQNSLNQSENGSFTLSGNLDKTYVNVTAKNFGFTPKFNLSYEPTKNLTAYATAAEGFRPGGVNQSVPPAVCRQALQSVGLTQAPISYNPDEVWSYEGGVKSRSSDGGVFLNADFYYNQWNQIQQFLTLSCGYGYTTNAGAAVTYGPELEGAYRIDSHWTFNFNGTYTHAKLTQTQPGSGYTIGQQILNIPQFSTNTSLVYKTSLTDDIDMTARIDDSTVGRSDDVSYSYIPLRAYNLVNLRVAFDQGPRNLAVYVNNVSNVHAQLSADNTALTTNIPDLYRIATNQPLTVGVDFTVHF